MSTWIAPLAAAAGMLLLTARPGATGLGVRLPRLLPAALGLVVVVRPGHWTVLAVIGFGAAWAAHRLWMHRRESRAAGETSAKVVEVCDLLAAELAAGSSPEAALVEVVDAWPPLRPVADASRLGGDVPLALRAVADQPGAGGLRMMAGAWAVSQRTGAGLAESARRVADAVRREQATRRLVAGELSSARATARLVSCLPLLALTMGSGAGANPWAFLLGTPVGLSCLAGGLAIGFVGLGWIELIARGVES